MTSLLCGSAALIVFIKQAPQRAAFLLQTIWCCTVRSGQGCVGLPQWISISCERKLPPGASWRWAAPAECVTQRFSTYVLSWKCVCGDGPSIPGTSHESTVLLPNYPTAPRSNRLCFSSFHLVNLCRCGSCFCTAGRDLCQKENPSWHHDTSIFNIDRKRNAKIWKKLFRIQHILCLGYLSIMNKSGC